MGDAAGIGPEIIIKAAVSPAVRRRCALLIVGSVPVFQKIICRLRSPLRVRKIVPSTPLGVASRAEPRDATGSLRQAPCGFAQGLRQGGEQSRTMPVGLYEPRWVFPPATELSVLEPGGLPGRPPAFGRVSAQWGAAAMECVKTGVRLVRAGAGRALVTAPINKTGIRRAGYRFQGHTDFLARLTGARRHAMMLVGGDIRVVLVTVHIPLSRVAAALSIGGIADTIRLAHGAMLSLGIPSPRIAVAGLNPHGGERGAFGREEIEIIRPAVERCRRSGIAVEGPLSPDTLFYKIHHGRYDVAVAMYHDQGLIPLKMLKFAEGVNVTLGLPIVRTSPDHGTAYDIAGKGVADPRSLIEAIKLACRLSGKK